MTPYLVTPPADLPVSLHALKAHLRVTQFDDDASLEELQAGVVGALDGWGGVLGRCIMPQVWAVDVEGPGPHRLPFPDATEVTANGDAVEPVRRRDGLWVTAEAAAPGEAVTITATYGLPQARLATAQTLVKLMVAREYDAPQGPAYEALSRSIQAHLTPLRWGRL